MRPSALTPLLLALALACGEKDATVEPDDSAAPVDPCPGDGDADNDGACDAVDCAPDDPYSYPGANDIPYDGKDNDCAGDGDLVDVDGDGHIGTLAGGDDCNDGNPTVYPGAPEVCYDGVDQDCAGDEDSNDCDGDGFDGRGEDASDCDDNDPEVYPGQVETWYNGVDNDCSGYQDSDYDADGDGDDIEGHEDGTDCDDTDPLTAGGNAELWDGADRNCDGQIDNLDIGDSLAAWFGDRGIFDGFQGMQVAVLHDFDGDGTASVAVGGYGNADGAYSGAVYIVDPADGGNFLHSSAHASIAGNEGAYLGFDLANIGDIDGDGLPELAVGGPVANNQGAALIYRGSHIANGGALAQTSALATLTGNANVGIDVAALGDVNGDGVPDIGVGTGWLTVAHLVVYSGAEVRQGGAYGPVTALSQIDGSATGGLSAGGLDVDGDGQAEVLVGLNTGGPGNVAVVNGVDASSEGAVDASDATRIRGGTGEGLGLTNGWMDDVDGNGYPEVLARAYSADGEATLGGLVYVIDGSELLGGDVTASAAAFYTVRGTVENGHVHTAERTGDHDGDGREDLLLVHAGDREWAWSLEGVPGVTATAYVHLADQVAAGGTALASDSTVSIRSESQDDLMGYGLAVGDIDGNGLADVVFGIPAGSATAGGAMVIPSFLSAE